jgi:hypothetical protein
MTNQVQFYKKLNSAYEVSQNLSFGQWYNFVSKGGEFDSVSCDKNAY